MLSDDSSEWRFPNGATPQGSAEYYAVRFSAPAQRSLNAMLLAWHKTIRDICDRPHDPGVARLKLDWWRNEIDAFESGRSRHPLLRSLRDDGLSTSASGAMLRVIDAADHALDRPEIADDVDFVTSCRGDRGTLFALLQAIHGSVGNPDIAGNFGGYCSAVRRIQLLAEHPDHVPPDCTAESLRAMPATQRRMRLDLLLQQFSTPKQATQYLPEVARRLTANALAMHKKMRHSRYAVADQLIDRAPLSLLWTAWRAR
ncbi:MAG: squalene/phytoene synthase family protein [Gammaproteobacteria bacterium]|nr:squalene/phytoene synthase family protein [Gammaproteobacteria bacterium]